MEFYNTSFVNWVYCILMIMFGVAGYLVSLHRSKDKLNPFGIVTLIWCFLAGVANLHLSWMETPWTVEMYVIVTIFPLIVQWCGLAGKNKMVTNDKVSFVHFSNMYIYLTRLLFVICLLCALLEWRLNGFSIALSSGLADAKSSVKSIPVVHYGTIYLPYCSINSIFELIYRKSKTRRTNIYLCMSIVVSIGYSLLASASRGNLLIVFCAFAYLFLRKYRISFRWIIILIAGMLAGFIVISKIRIFSGSLVYDVIHGHPIVSSVYSYTALNFENLNQLIKRGSSYSLIRYTYGGFLQLLGLDRFFPEPQYIMTYFFNANTICYDFYEDLGFLGVILNTFILFSVIRIIYRKSITDRRYLLLFACMQKGIWVVFFGNYFTIYRVMLYPFLVTGIVVYSMNLEFKFRSLKLIKKKGLWKTDNEVTQ